MIIKDGFGLLLQKVGVKPLLVTFQAIDLAEFHLYVAKVFRFQGFQKLQM